EDVEGSPYYSSLLYQTYDNVEISIDMSVVENQADENEFGLSCRYVDNDNNYEFRVFADGWVGIAKRLEGEYIDLFAPQSVGGHLGNDPVRITAVCAGDYLALWRDDELVAEANDDSFTSGYVGLSAYVATGGSILLAGGNAEASARAGSQASNCEYSYVDAFSCPSAGWNGSGDAEAAR